MAKRPAHDDFDRDILDIIPERYDADEDSQEARSGSRFRSFLTIGVSLVLVAGIVVAGWKFMGSRHLPGTGMQVIKADDKPVKVRPDDRGGMQVPNQDKLVYGQMESDSESQPKTEHMLSPPEEPRPPPRPEEVSATPPPVAAAPVAAPPMAAAPPVAAPPAATPPAKVAKADTVMGEKAAPADKVAPDKAGGVKSVPVPSMAPTPSASVAPKPVSPPAVAAVTPPVVAAPMRKSAESSGDYLVQLGAVRSADAADKEWSRIQRANSELLTGLSPDVMQVDLPGKGTFWRIRAGSLSEPAARQLCTQLAGRNQGCIVVHK